MEALGLMGQDSARLARRYSATVAGFAARVLC
jgi:hypothetical protein